MNMKFTLDEGINLLIAFIVISLGFSITIVRTDFNAIMYVLPIIMIGAGLGFILHEIGHKLSAIHYGYWAEFKMWPTGLVISLISSVAGILIALPGAVNIYGNLTEHENGVISLCGPIVNIALSLIFLIIGKFYLIDGIYGNSIIFLICNLGYQINAYLAFFNLLPLGILDGAKIMRWNPGIWIVTIAISAILSFGPRFGIVLF